jgi:hypothetical protein
LALLVGAPASAADKKAREDSYIKPFRAAALLMAQDMPVETLTAGEAVLADYEAQFAHETRPTYASAADYANIADDFGKTIEQTRA